MVATINDLPSELISKITSCLDQVSLYRLSMTSKGFSQATEGLLYRNPVVKGIERTSILLRACVSRRELLRYIDTVTLKKSSQVNSLPIATDATEFVAIRKCQSLCTEIWLEPSMMVAFPGLRKLHVHGIDEHWKRFVDLERQNSNGYYSFYDEPTINFFASSTQLSTLRITDYGLSPEYALPLWQSLNRRLRYLEIEYAPNDTSSEFREWDLHGLGECASTLVSLSVNGRSSSNAFDLVTTSLPDLQSLSLRVSPPLGLFERTFRCLSLLVLDLAFWEEWEESEIVLSKLIQALDSGLLPRLRRIRILFKENTDPDLVEDFESLFDMLGSDVELEIYVR